MALLLLFALLTLESFGLPVPGETVLIACSVLASQGRLSIEWVIVVGVLAAIIGDNLGYWAAREGGRPLLERYSLTRRMRSGICREVNASSPSTAARRSSSVVSSPCSG